MKSKFSEHQIISILKQTENGRTVAEVCRENSVSSSTYFKWKTKYGAPVSVRSETVPWVGRRKPAIEKNVRRFVIGEPRFEGRDRKKALEPVAKKAVVAHLQSEHQMSERRACRLVSLARSVFRYAAHPRDDREVQAALAALAQRHPEFGFRKMFTGALGDWGIYGITSGCIEYIANWNWIWNANTSGEFRRETHYRWRCHYKQIRFGRLILCRMLCGTAEDFAPLMSLMTLIAKPWRLRLIPAFQPKELCEYLTKLPFGADCRLASGLITDRSWPPWRWQIGQRKTELNLHSSSRDERCKMVSSNASTKLFGNYFWKSSIVDFKGLLLSI